MSTDKSTGTADKLLRESMAALPLPNFGEPAFVGAPRAADARVAIVTTSGLMRPGEPAWTHDDSSFRVIKREERNLLVGHVSMHFDRAGISADLNVAYPIDRLEEMAAAGTIGSVASKHIAFMGALRSDNLISNLILDSGPAAAKVLLDDGVNVVILTPVCPACARTVLILAHVFERCGIATIVLASNLKMTERAQPPRALYCDFPLGQPVGRPQDSALQRRVLGAALALLEREQGPVLEVFPEAIHDAADAPMTCTLPPRFDPSLPPEVDEARGLRAAWERHRERAGRSDLGRVLTAATIGEGISAFIKIREGAQWQTVFESEDRMMQTAMDIRVYYEEAALALADHVPAARAAEAWFYQQTQTGKLLQAVVIQLRESGQEAALGFMALYYLVPLSQFPGAGGSAPWAKDLPQKR